MVKQLLLKVSTAKPHGIMNLLEIALNESTYDISYPSSMPEKKNPRLICVDVASVRRQVDCFASHMTFLSHL